MFVIMFAKIKQQFLSIFFPITIFLSACAAQQQSVEILHINDSHSYLSGISQNGKPNYDNQSSKGGFARINNVIKNHQNSVVLDAGDRFQGSLYFSLFGSEPIIKIDNASSFSALTLGNHEFDNGCKFLNSYINQLKTPVLVANMRLNTRQNCPLTMDKIQAFLVKELHNGDKIGIIGISHDNPKISILSKDCDCIDFVDYKTAIITQINALKAQKINKIILLTHLGLDKDIDIAKNIADIDIIVGGHSHSYLGDDANEKADGTYPIVITSPNNEPVLIVQAKFGTEYLGYLKASFDNYGVITSFDGKAIKLTGNEYPQDETINAILAPYNEKISQNNQTIVGNNQISMNDGLKECRQSECLSALLLSLAFLEQTKNFEVQIAFNNAGSSRAALPVGEIKEMDLLSSFPFGNNIVIKELSGDEIKQALEQGVANTNFNNLSALLQPANLKYTINRNRPMFDRISNIQIKTNGKWKNINRKAKYKVAMNNYIGNGKDGFEVLKNAKTIKVLQQTDIEALREYLKKHSPLNQIETNLIIFK